MLGNIDFGTTESVILLTVLFYKSFCCKRLQVNRLVQTFIRFFQFKRHALFLVFSFVSTLVETKWKLSFEKNRFKSFSSCKYVLSGFVKKVCFASLRGQFLFCKYVFIIFV